MKRISTVAILGSLLLLASCGTSVERTPGEENPNLVQVAKPVFSPVGGTHANPVPVTITTTTENAQIYYTLDGTDPTESSTLYSNSITISQTTTLTARGFRSDLTPSLATQETYTILFDPNQVLSVTISPPGGSYSSPQTITMSSATTGANIYYTLDGSDPDDTSTQYSGSFPLSQNTTVKAIAYQTGMNPSLIAESIYTFEVVTPYETAQIEIWFNCDGTDKVIVDNGILSFEHVSGGLPSYPWVQITRPNGTVTTIPAWNRMPTSLQLPNLIAGTDDFIVSSSIQIISGRGSVSRTSQNQITVHDGPAGFDGYWFIFQYSYPVPAQ